MKKRKKKIEKNGFRFFFFIENSKIERKVNKRKNTKGKFTKLVINY